MSDTVVNYHIVLECHYVYDNVILDHSVYSNSNLVNYESLYSNRFLRIYNVKADSVSFFNYAFYVIDFISVSKVVCRYNVSCFFENVVVLIFDGSFENYL